MALDVLASIVVRRSSSNQPSMGKHCGIVTMERLKMETTHKIFLTLDEVKQVTGLGRSTIYTLMNTGKIKAVKVGHRTLFRPSDLQEFANSREAYAA
ncbi:helix-turn-helix domain-containing protein [Mesorhizobium sp. M0220]|uniref:helix-turn-helix transcriptional regulator n=1 Tax=Mesorhizobium sp. M0220 TaxID=2956920 RepID=UPI00333AA022